MFSKSCQTKLKKSRSAKCLPSKQNKIRIVRQNIFFRGFIISFFLVVFTFSFLLFTFFERKSADLLAIPSAQAQTQDAIAIRVMENPKHLSPERWYQENAPHPGNPQSAVIDGYQAVRDGRTVYVAAANLGDDNLLYANIYLISYTEGASAATQKIFDQLLANWSFNVNILPAGAGKVCSNDYTTNCEQDKDCPSGETCLSIEPKPRLTRDVKRLADLQDVRKELEDYNYQAGSFPTLSAGTYLPRLSFSVWPSWQKTLGQALGETLAQDPVNKFYGCGDPYDKTTCWDNKALAFACPANYYIYAYKSPTATGDQAKLYTELEYQDQNWASTLDILTNPQELLENCQLNFGQNTNDYDNDTVPNGVDNCPTIPNQAQTDSDGDKIGDACDGCPNDPQNDQDNDGYCVGLASLVFGDKKDQDNCPTVYNPSQEENPDLPGVGLACSRCQDADQDSFCSYQTGGDDCDDTNPAVHPGAPEIANGVDDNCNGRVDECPQVGLTQPCYTGPIGTEGVGICKAGSAFCNSSGVWMACRGQILPKTELCDATEIDSDCDGNPDNGCDADGDGECATGSGCYATYGNVGNGCPNGCCDPDDGDAGVNAGSSCTLVNNQCQCATTFQTQPEWGQGVGVNIKTNVDWLEINPIYTPYIWVASSGNNSVYRVNADNNAVAGPFAVGVNPSRTAVAMDNTVWVANRGGDCGVSAANTITHLDVNGATLKTCTVGFGPRAVTIDAQGYVWVGNYCDGTVYKLDPNTCAILENINIGGNPYGGATDGLGNLWISNRFNDDPGTPENEMLTKSRVIKINTQNNQVECSTFLAGPYGIAIDKNNKVWSALWEGQAAKRINQNCQIEITTNFSTNARAIAVDKDNNVWVTHTLTDRVTKLDNNGNILFAKCTDPTMDCSVTLGANPIGVTAITDINNNSFMWVVNYTTARASKFDLNGNLVAAVNVGVTPYTYSDMAGYMLRTVTLRSATWMIKLDSQVATPVWRSVIWDETEPTNPQGNSYARIRIRSAASEVALDADPDGSIIPWSNYFNAPPINILQALPTFNHQRWLQVQVDLHLSFDDQSPTVDNLRVELSY